MLIILPSYDSGGAENYALRLICHSANAEIDWHVTTGNLRNAQLEPIFEAAGAQTHHVSTGFISPRKALAFARFLRRYKFDAVMGLNGVFSGPAMQIARMVGVPRRIAWHRRSTPAYRPTLARRLYALQTRRWLEYSSTHILSNSRTALDHFHGRNWSDDSRFEVIPNGVDASRFRPRPNERAAIRAELDIPPEAIVIGHVGRVDPAKDHDTLFAATRLLIQHRDNIHLLLAGTGTDTAALHARIRDVGLTEIYHGLGVRTDTERVYQAMDVFLFPSLTEGQPNAVIEAMLSEVPIVASDIEPIRDAVPETIHDQLFLPKRSDQAAEIVLSLINRKLAMSTASVRSWAISRYSPDENFSRVLDILTP